MVRVRNIVGSIYTLGKANNYKSDFVASPHCMHHYGVIIKSDCFRFRIMCPCEATFMITTPRPICLNNNFPLLSFHIQVWLKILILYNFMLLFCFLLCCFFYPFFITDKNLFIMLYIVIYYCWRMYYGNFYYVERTFVNWYNLSPIQLLKIFSNNRGGSKGEGGPNWKKYDFLA